MIGHIYIYIYIYIKRYIYEKKTCEKNTCLNYREFDLEVDLVGIPHKWNLLAQSFITLLKLVWREEDIVAINEWKKKSVGFQRT